MSTPRVGVIVVSYNSARYLPRLLAAMERQTFRDFRLLIVDNASRAEERPNGLPGEVMFEQLEENIGFAAANNRGARAFEGSEFIATLNPDAFPEPDWLARLLAAGERHREAAAFGSTQFCADIEPLTFDGTGDVMHASGFCWRSNHRRPAAGAPLWEAQTFSACAAAALYRRADFIAAGGFDERFFAYVEDVDLGYRLRLAGRATIQVPDAIVHHVGGGSTGGVSARADFLGARNRVWCFVKNTPALLLLAMTLAHLALTFAVLMLHALSGRGLHGFRGFLAGLAGLGPIWQARRAVQRSARASMNEIARALAWSPTLLASRRAKWW